MGKAVIWFGGTAVAFFIGYATVPPTTASWVIAVLRYGFIVAGVLFCFVGLAYLIPIAKRHLNPLDIHDDWRCTYWSSEKQFKVTLWFSDKSGATDFYAKCVAQFDQQVFNVNDGVTIGGTYMGKTGLKSGQDQPIMVEFLKHNIVITNPKKARVTVSLKPKGIWPTKKRTKEVNVQVINR